MEQIKIGDLVLIPGRDFFIPANAPGVAIVDKIENGIVYGGFDFRDRIEDVKLTDHFNHAGKQYWGSKEYFKTVEMGYEKYNKQKYK